MAVWWPHSQHSCRVDLGIARVESIRTAVKCAYPNLPIASQAALVSQLTSTALALQSAVTTVGGVGQAIDQIGDSVARAVGGGVNDILGDVGDALGNVIGNLSSGLRQDINQVGAALNSTIATITSGASNAVKTAGDAVSSVVSSVRSGVNNAISSAAGAITGVINQARTGVSNVIDIAGDVVGDVATRVTDTLGGLLNSAGSAIGGVIKGLQDGAVSLIGGAASAVGTAVDGIRRFIGKLIDSAAEGIGAIAAKLGDIPGTIANVADDILAAAGGGLDKLIEGIGKFLSDPIEGIIGGFFHGEEPMLLDMVNDLYDRMLSNPETPPEVRQAINKAKVPGAPVPAIVAAVVIPFILVTCLGIILNPVLQKVVQEENKHVRPTLIGLGDAVQSHYRGTMTRAQLADFGARSGYEDIDVERALVLGRVLPTPVDMTDWMHRGLVTKGHVAARLEDAGWQRADADNVIESAALIPPVGDLVRFAVREAFPGQTGYGGARGSGVPDRFTDLAEKQGLDPEFARSYWAAHWELPSVTAAFAMYHRRLITGGQLRALLREQDLAPEWIDDMIAVAFDPLTRVDVRRMRAVGVLSRADVKDAYLDLGYSPQNAERLADFVEEDIKQSRSVETSTERDLTRADIVGAYADGVLNRSQAKGYLVSLGYSADESELVLDREDIRVVRAERKETKAAIVAQAVAAVIDVNTAQDKLAAASYTDDEIKTAVKEIDRQIAAQVRQPTKAELDAFRKARLITDEEYAVELRRLGYAERWITAFVKLGQRGGSSLG